MKYWCLGLILGSYLLSVCLYGESIYKVVRKLNRRKYDDDNPDISTATPSYILGDATTREKKVHDDWRLNSHLDNDDFKASVQFRLPFDIDDTETLRVEHPEVVCMPDVFGYSKAQGDQVFPPFEYPDCADTLTSPQAKITMDFQENTVDITCPNKAKSSHVTLNPKFSLRKQYLQFEMEDFWEPLTSSALTPSNEFVYASCSDPPVFNSAVYQPRFNQSVHDRAESLMKAKAEEVGLAGKVRPMTVLMLTVDSFSRRHFFRKLPKTVKLLNSLNQNGTYALFDFKLSNIQDAATVDNIVPFFGSTP